MFFINVHQHIFLRILDIVILFSELNDEKIYISNIHILSAIQNIFDLRGTRSYMYLGYIYKVINFYK